MEMDLTINLDKARAGHLVARAYNHALRKQLIELLIEEGELNVTQIYTHKRFRDRASGRYLEQSQVSANLAILKSANLVKDRREGKNIYYTVNKPALEQITASIAALAKNYLN